MPNVSVVTPCRYCAAPVQPVLDTISASRVANREACGLHPTDVLELCHLICLHCGFTSVCWHRANDLN